MDRLTGVEELLDGPLDDEAALVGNLRDLARLNRLTGGTALSRLAIGTLGALGAAGGRGASGATVLDVGTGGADIPIDLLTRPGPGGRVRAVVASDSRDEILAAARRAHPSLERVSGLTLAVADGRALPWGD